MPSEVTVTVKADTSKIKERFQRAIVTLRRDRLRIILGHVMPNRTASYLANRWPEQLLPKYKPTRWGQALIVKHLAHMITVASELGKAISETMQDARRRQEEQVVNSISGGSALSQRMGRLDKFDLEQSYLRVHDLLSQPRAVCIWLVGENGWQVDGLERWIIQQVATRMENGDIAPDYNQRWMGNVLHVSKSAIYGLPLRSWYLHLNPGGDGLPVPATPGVWIEMKNAPSLLLARINEDGIIEPVESYSTERCREGMARSFNEDGQDADFRIESSGT